MSPQLLHPLLSFVTRLPFVPESPHSRANPRTAELGLGLFRFFGSSVRLFLGFSSILGPDLHLVELTVKPLVRVAKTSLLAASKRSWSQGLLRILVQLPKLCRWRLPEFSASYGGRPSFRP